MLVGERFATMVFSSQVMWIGFGKSAGSLL
ncbi:hypothetical protein B398_10300 [Xylella fastidiosa 32]|nr:hypothetical protein B398_10300 [Xylella fastidiosa 32]